MHTHRVQPFALRDVQLLDGPFKTAQDLQVQSLLRYEPDRLLARFRTEAGLEPRARHYDGWEGGTIAGHCLGHYLSGCALMFASTGDGRFLERVQALVDGLGECQAAGGGGYLGAAPGARRVFEEQVARGDIRRGVSGPPGFDINGFWVPFYAWHKVFAGLRDAWRLCGSAKALEVEARFADWVGGVLSGLSEDQVQDILACEHGGMNEVLAHLWADTGDARYLALSRRFHHKAVLDPLARGQDCLPGLHANTQVPKLIGLAERYLLAGDEDDRRAAEFFWERVVNHHSYVTGGHCLDEHFGPPDRLSERLGQNTTETCNVYNMLKLTRAIFQWRPRAELADFYERALLNHIRATQHPADGRVVYNLTLEMGGYKIYQDPFGFTCCVGTGMESHAKYGDSIYFRSDDALYVNLFIASEARWAEKGVTLRQETGYPESDRVRLCWACAAPADLALKIRHPAWCVGGAQLWVNGRRVPVTSEPGTYIHHRRAWADGDTVELRLPMSLRLEAMPDEPHRVAVFHGPRLLAGDLGAVSDPDAWQTGFVPVLETGGRLPGDWLRPVRGERGAFKTRGVARPRDLRLTPFAELHDRRYMVYWDCVTAEEWAARQAAIAAERKAARALEARTVDYVRAGDPDSEGAHHLHGDRTWSGARLRRSWRVAHGWMSYEMSVRRGGPLALVATYWGGEDPGHKRRFDILVDGVTVASQDLAANAPGEFFDVEYPLPEELVRGKERITVRLQPQPDANAVGDLFGLRVVRAASGKGGIT